MMPKYLEIIKKVKAYYKENPKEGELQCIISAKFIESLGLIKLEEDKKPCMGCLVGYFNEKNDKSELIHLGIVEVDKLGEVTIISKQGIDFIHKHKVQNALYEYNKIIYFHPPCPEEMMIKLELFYNKEFLRSDLHELESSKLDVI